MTKNKKIYSGLILLVIVIFAITKCILNNTEMLSISTPKASDEAKSPVAEEIVSRETNEVVSEVKFLDTFNVWAGTVKISLPVTGESLLSILTKAKENGEIIFSGKDYPGLGFFVTEVGSIREGDGKHLLYSINSKEASVGVSHYVPKANDIIVWELK